MLFSVSRLEMCVFSLTKPWLLVSAAGSFLCGTRVTTNTGAGDASAFDPDRKECHLSWSAAVCVEAGHTEAVGELNPTVLHPIQ